jgi:integrin alpha FG-GAP repeat containing protein 1
MSQSSSSQGQLDLFLYRAAAGGGLGEILDQFTPTRRSLTVIVEITPLLLPPSTESQPIPFDSTGDLRIDLLGIPSSSGDRESFSVWENVWNESLPNSAVYELFVHNCPFLFHVTADLLSSGRRRHWRIFGANLPTPIAMLLWI